MADGLNIGAMRDVIRIERRSATQDAAGEPALSWIFVARCRAEYVPADPGREVFTSEKRQGLIPTTFKLRFREGVVPAMRVILEGWNKVDQVATEQVFDIISAVNPDRVKVQLVISAEEHVEETP